MCWRGLRVIAAVAILATVTVTRVPAAWSVDAAPSTTTTILPLAGMLMVSPVSGSPGSLISVSPLFLPDNCAGLGGAFVVVTLTSDDSPDAVLASDQTNVNPGPWHASLVVPDDADPARSYAVSGRCATESTTIFHYVRTSFEVTVPVSTSSSEATGASTSTSSSTGPGVSTSFPSQTTVAEVGVVASTGGGPSTTVSVATLPRTGADDSFGISAIGVSFVGAGLLLILSRRRPRFSDGNRTANRGRT